MGAIYQQTIGEKHASEVVGGQLLAHRLTRCVGTRRTDDRRPREPDRRVLELAHHTIQATVGEVGTAGV